MQSCDYNVKLIALLIKLGYDVVNVIQFYHLIEIYNKL